MDIKIATEEVRPMSRRHPNDDPPIYRCDCGYWRTHYGADDCFAYLHDRLTKIEAMLNIKRED